MNPIAEQLNRIVETANPFLMEMLSDIGKALFFPKGILSQGAEANEKAYRINATIGIATEGGRTMCFPSVTECIPGIAPEASLTYAPSFGIPELRKTWKKGLIEKNPSLAGKGISLPVVTCGVTNAISVFADLWVDPEDVIIIPEMMWGNYNMIFCVRKGARMKHYPLFSNSWGFNLTAFDQTVAEAVKTKKKIIVLLNFPHNPTGYTVNEAEAGGIVEILTATADKGTNVIAVTDDSYFGLNYEDGPIKESLFAMLCGRSPRLLGVKLDGATKENFVWGLRVGFITYGAVIRGDAAPVYDALEKKTAGCIRGNISSASHLGQTIVLKSITDERHPFEKTAKFEVLKSRAKRVKEVVSDPRYNAAWEVYPFNSGYFMCIRLKSVDSETLRVHLLDKYGVGLISMGTHDLRIAFSCLEEGDITELFDTILKGVEDLTVSGPK